MGGQRKALIVATGRYEHGELARLASPAADAEALAAVLGDATVGDFDVDVVANADSHVIQRRVEDLFSDGRPDDVLLLHFSCHGLKSESGELFFAASNTRPDRLASTAVPADFVQRCMRASRSRSVVVLLDCCYGGAFREGVAIRASGDVNVLDSFPSGRLGGGGRGRAVITASSSIEYAFEGDRLADDHSKPSVFTGALVQGLASGDADRDEDGWVSLNELYDYLYDRVREQQPNQTPSRDIEMQGELYLARSKRRRIRASPIPVDLRAAMTDGNMFTRLGALSELRTRLNSPNLEVAAGAFEAVTEMAGTDLQNIANAAALILREAALSVSEPAVRFHLTANDSSTGPPRTVRLLGPPLARACTHEVSHDWIHVDVAEEELTVSVDARNAEDRQGYVTLTSPTGNAVITVDVGKPSAVPEEPKPSSNVDERGKPPARRDRKRTVAGTLAVVSGLLMIVGLFPSYMSIPYDSWHVDLSLDAKPLWYRAEGMYFLAVGWFVILAGILTLIQRTRKLVGPGLLGGALPAAVWGLVFLISEESDGSARDGHTWEVGAHVLLLAAAALAVGTLATDRDVRLVRRPQGVLVRLVMVLAVAGMVILFMHRLDLYDAALGHGATKASVAAIVAALVVPMVVALMVPRRLGACVLVGWIATTAAVAVFYSTIFADPDRKGIWINLFLVLLAGFAVVARYLWRSEAQESRQSPEIQHGELRLAGILAVLGGTAMIYGLIPTYMDTPYDSSRVWQDVGRVALSDRAEGMYFLAIAVLTIVAGTLTLVRRTRRFTGPGLLIGAVTAAVWGLVFLFGGLADMGGTEQPFTGFWVELFAHFILVVAAILAAGALIGEARLVRPEGSLAWWTVTLAVAGAVIFLLHRNQLDEDGLGSGTTAASFAAIAATLVLPVFASVIVPPRLAAVLLAGWITATAAVVAYNFSVIQDFGQHGDWITIFCLPLMGLAIVAGHRARAVPGFGAAYLT